MKDEARGPSAARCTEPAAISLIKNTDKVVISWLNLNESMAVTIFFCFFLRCLVSPVPEALPVMSTEFRDRSDRCPG